MPRLGKTKKPSSHCVKWKHDRSKCYDRYEKMMFMGKEIEHWSIHCQELDRVANQAVRSVNRIFK